MQAVPSVQPSIADLAASPADLEGAIGRATEAILALQREDGHWVFELEADATIPAEYVLLKHFLGEPADLELEAKIANYLRRIQAAHGGWPLFHEGAFNISASVKAYFALKMIGDPVEAPHMVRARETILAHGGAATCNVFTRALLALYAQIPWRGVPVMPVEIMLLPRWFPFHLDKISYWARTVLVPLLVLMALKPRARNPRGIGIAELFVVPPARVRNWPKGPHQVQPWSAIFGAVDRLLRRIEPLFPGKPRRRAIDRAAEFVIERLNGEDGLGAIFPAMANTVMMFEILGYPHDDPRVVLARRSIEKLLVVKEHEAYCQPCLSPIWDTALVCHALMEAGGERAADSAIRGLDWLKPLQELETVGDWAVQRPHVRPGGWAFQYANPHYPDLDDTAVVVMAMDRAAAKGGEDYRTAIARGREWVEGLQSRNGGWGAFDADNDHDYLNYIYGTWSVLAGLNAAGVDLQSPEIRRAVDWLVRIQNPDGGWGEDGDSYKLGYKGYEPAPSTASQTAWALLALMAAGEVEHPAVARGIFHLQQHQAEDGLWAEERYTATGFPRVFYLRYHGYGKFFPLWAMARYRNLTKGNTRAVLYGL